MIVLFVTSLNFPPMSIYFLRMTFELSSFLYLLFARRLGSPQPIFAPPSISSLCMERTLIPICLFVLQVHGSQREALTYVQMSCKYGKAQF